MTQRYEYKFLRLGEGWTGVRKSGKEDYKETIEEQAKDGWRLVQIFAPGIGSYGSAKYYELILERKLP